MAAHQRQPEFLHQRSLLRMVALAQLGVRVGRVEGPFVSDHEVQPLLCGHAQPGVRCQPGRGDASHLGFRISRHERVDRVVPVDPVRHLLAVFQEVLCSHVAVPLWIVSPVKVVLRWYSPRRGRHNVPTGHGAVEAYILHLCQSVRISSQCRTFGAALPNRRQATDLHRSALTQTPALLPADTDGHSMRATPRDEDGYGQRKCATDLRRSAQIEATVVPVTVVHLSSVSISEDQWLMPYVRRCSPEAAPSH